MHFDDLYSYEVRYFLHLQRVIQVLACSADELHSPLANWLAVYNHTLHRYISYGERGDGLCIHGFESEEGWNVLIYYF